MQRDVCETCTKVCIQDIGSRGPLFELRVHAAPLQECAERVRKFHMHPSVTHACSREEGGRRSHRIPYLQLDLLVVDGDHARTELHSNGEVMDGLKALVRELQEQT